MEGAHVAAKRREMAHAVCGKLAARCKALLTERINICRALCVSRHVDGTQDGKGHIGAGSEWQDRSARLYGLAAEVSEKLQGKMN